MHFHVVLTTKFGTQLAELEYDKINDAAVTLTGLLNNFYEENLKYENVLERLEQALMIQGGAAIEGPISFYVFECIDKCRADLTGRN